MTQYCLVTTALEQTWDKDHANLFLGLWAQPYDRRHVWGELLGSLCEPCGQDLAKRQSDFEVIQHVADGLLEDLVFGLNALHGKNHTKRYWNILCGHWLQRFVSTMFNRYDTLKSAFEHHAISHSYVLNPCSYIFSTNDSSGLITAANDPLWNHQLYARIMRDISSLRLIPIEDGGRQLPEKKVEQHASWRLRALVGDLADKASAWLARDTDALIVSSYLPGKQANLLSLALGQLPQRWKAHRLPDWNHSEEMRRQLATFIPDRGDEFEYLAGRYLPDFFPRCFLEGYRDLQSIAANLHWPSHPRFIFTSNSFDSDEVFKVWTAGKVAAGVPYIVGQHGAGYGTHNFFQTRYAPEHSSSDGFLTWGWCNDNLRNIPAFVFKTAGQAVSGKLDNTADQLVVIAPVQPNQITHWDSLYEFSLNQDVQFALVRSLPDEIRQRTVVRLHHDAAKCGWRDIERWHEAVPDVAVDSGLTSLDRQYRKIRLAVFAYDSTGLLEFLAMDRPAIGIWHGGLSHLMPQAQVDYQVLVGAGIIYTDPQKAAEWIAENWHRIPLWWRSAELQRAREFFCNKYARQSHKPVRELKRLLLSVRPTG